MPHNAFGTFDSFAPGECPATLVGPSRPYRPLREPGSAVVAQIGSNQLRPIGPSVIRERGPHSKNSELRSRQPATTSSQSTIPSPLYTRMSVGDR